MRTIFVNFGNSNFLDPHRILLNLLDKINVERNNKYVDLSNFSIYYTIYIYIYIYIYKSHTKTIKLKYQLQLGKKTELPDGSYCVSDIP